MRRGWLALSVVFVLTGCATEGDPFGGSEVLDNALAGQVYALPEGTPRLPDFSALTPLGTIYATSLDVAPRNFSEGFPGIRDRSEWFGLRYEGTLRVQTAGTYTFALRSDDGSRLRVGSQLVVDNDFVHNLVEKTGTLTLAAAEHPLVLEYFQGPRYESALQLLITPPGQSTQIFDSTVVY